MYKKEYNIIIWLRYTLLNLKLYFISAFVNIPIFIKCPCSNDYSFYLLTVYTYLYTVYTVYPPLLEDK